MGEFAYVFAYIVSVTSLSLSVSLWSVTAVTVYIGLLGPSSVDIDVEE